MQAGPRHRRTPTHPPVFMLQTGLKSTSSQPSFRASASAPMDSSAEVAAEVEALWYTYGEAECSEQPPITAHEGHESRVFHISAHPLTGEDAQSRFLEATLRLTVPPDYPHASPPIVELLDAKGIGDARQRELTQLLKSEAEGLRGELCLGHLVETARAWMTEHNVPEGACAFCLADMGADAAQQSRGQLQHQQQQQQQQGAGENGLVRLPCFHAFHRCVHTCTRCAHVSCSVLCRPVCNCV